MPLEVQIQHQKKLSRVEQRHGSILTVATHLQSEILTMSVPLLILEQGTIGSLSLVRWQTQITLSLEVLVSLAAGEIMMLFLERVGVLTTATYTQQLLAQLLFVGQEEAIVIETLLAQSFLEKIKP